MPQNTINISFRSGMTNISDFFGCIDANQPIGVVAGKLTTLQAVQSLPRYLDRGGKVFIDSGAFTAFRTKEPMDWPKVLGRYSIISELTDHPENLFVVSPDCVGDQHGTLALTQGWRDHILKLIQYGTHVIIPLQCGTLPAQAMIEHIAQILGTRNWIAGIPSNKAAMSVEECATLSHNQFHILGRVTLNSEQDLRLKALRRNNPSAFISADANWLRSHIALISRCISDTPSSGGAEDFRHRRSRAVTRALQIDHAWGQAPAHFIPSGSLSHGHHPPAMGREDEAPKPSNHSKTRLAA